ncbi:MAG: electron transfer flavoprotein-ubiquinone oxidoreductase [Cellvibrionaceae bacterium]
MSEVQTNETTTIERESMEYDVVIVGAGPAGLAAACRLAQLNNELSICIVEKGSEVGAHILSGAVFEPKVLTELFPDWQSMGAPLLTAVTEDQTYWLNNQEKATKIPALLSPKTFNNHGNYIISLGNLCRWLAEQAESLGVEIFPGFSAASILYDESGNVKGIITGDMGISADGTEKEGYAAGIELIGKYTLFSEGSRGHLGKQLIQQFNLDLDKDPQHYGIGIKELWQIEEKNHRPGLVMHTAGWPLQMSKSGGGGFLYHLENNQVAIGLITDLSYSNPYLSPYDEFQRFKHHPVIAQYLSGGERISYGARTITKGGLQSQPEMVFPGGLLLGDNAGTLNAAKIKGSHTAMKSGMVAAEVVAAAISEQRSHDSLDEFKESYKASWAWQELYEQRNFAPALHKWGNFLGGAYTFIDLNLFNGSLPWTLSDPAPDYSQLEQASDSQPIDYPKPDGKLSFDKLSSVFLSNTNHEEDQPCHLKLADTSIPVEQNLLRYDEPAQRYCPAGVYEIIDDDSGDKRLQINAQNCVHCKTCDIKDPSQNITWVTPEGMGGPNYPNM